MFKVVYKDKRFLIDTAYSNKNQIESIGAKWDKKHRRWSMPFTIDSYARLLNINSVISDKVHKHFSDKLQGLGSLSGEYPYKTEPRKHQKKLTLMGLFKKKAFYLCGVGTGKTKAALDMAVSLYKDSKIERVLIICPHNIIENWGIEIEKHTYNDYSLLLGSFNKRKKSLDAECFFYVTNYEMIGKLFLDEYNKKNSNFKFDMIIWDEAHFLKSRTSKRSKNSYRISKDVKYKLGLTGTMVANAPDDAFMPYKIIDPEVFGESYTLFKQKYLIMGGFDAGYGPTKVIGVNNKQEYMKKLALNSLKYELDDVVDIPEPVIMIRKFDLCPATRKIYNQTEDDWVLQFEHDQKVTANVLERMLRLSQISSGFMPKIEDYETIKNDYIDLSDEKIKALGEVFDEISDHEKVIVWCRFTHSIDRVANLCKKRGYSYYIYDGRQKDKGLYEQYQNDDTKVWIAQIQSGVGYSIPAAKYAIFYETDYSMVNHNQAKGRNRRLEGSEKGACVYIYLQARSSIEVTIYRTLLKKDFNASDLLSAIKGGKKSDKTKKKIQQNKV